MPDRASRPFDKNRDGFVIAEGAGVVVLEEYEHAKKRGATIIAEVAGYGMSGDGWNMTISPEDGIGQKLAIGAALADAELSPDQVQYVNAHATSTPAGDEIESQVLEAVFGQKITVSATKSMTGHMLGAAGGVETIFTALSVSRGEVPPTINLEHPSDNCRLDYVPHNGRRLNISAALNNSFGFGTTNAALVLKKV
jgi:3-oxoacyl-[acyl-carrier-protein] synthase II